MRRSLLLLLGTLFLVAGCGGGNPRVTWTVAGQESTVGPAQYCDIKLRDCTNDEQAKASLAVPAGAAVEISVPSEVSEAPWSVVFAYVGPDGQQTTGRSPVFTPKAQESYTLTLPEPGDTLQTAQVQLLGVAPVANPDSGELEFPTRATWLLVAQR
ncbi:DUF2771 family protein [Pseudonocardia xishanensis]|uniref:DUF2771 family protein n=1 Tax=Pseudonocardia xishanensis TaxID=630995 RepID=A0ABP8RL72_9PSEU